jgi:hypothetical protein
VPATTPDPRKCSQSLTIKLVGDLSGSHTGIIATSSQFPSDRAVPTAGSDGLEAPMRDPRFYEFTPNLDVEWKVESLGDRSSKT